MNKIQELGHRLFYEDTPEFQTWLRNRLSGVSVIATSVLGATAQWPNAFPVWVAKVAGVFLIGGIVGAFVAQTSKQDKPPVESTSSQSEVANATT